MSRLLTMATSTTDERGRPDASPATVSRRLDDPDWDAAAVAALRGREYSRLDARDHVYLDYTGGGLYAASQVSDHQALLRSTVLGNPHSDNPTSRVATQLADDARDAILDFLGASPDEYTVIFTANASAALKLVGEAYPFEAGSRLLLTADNHNSVNGIREFARSHSATLEYVPVRRSDLRLDGSTVRAALDRARPGAAHLFAFPAQSNYSGVRHPLDLVTDARARGWDVLLDAAAFVPTNRLDLSRWHPDFVSLSWYKVFGYPTGIGSLVVRHEALSRLRRPWFSGGSIGVASVVLPRHTLGEGRIGFEDGTIDYLGLPAIQIGLRQVTSIGMPTIHGRVQALTRWLSARMRTIVNADGELAVRLYGPTDDTDRGGTVTFNLLGHGGAIIPFRHVESAATEQRISLRTGCFCNPGASETARGITAGEMARIFALGRQPTGDDLRSILADKALGAVRVSVGIATTERDIDRFVAFLEELAAARA